MGEPSILTKESRSSSLSTSLNSNSSSNPTPRLQSISLVQPSQKNRKDKPKVVRAFRSVLRSFPIINPRCNFPTCPAFSIPTEPLISHPSGNRVTGTLFGFQKGKVSLSLQETTNCLPWLVIELALQTNALQKELNAGMVRIVLECEKKSDKVRLFDEPLWTMFCNGKKTGYGVLREATDDDLSVMEHLKPVSMGAGVLPFNKEIDGSEGDLTYMRACFEQVVGSKDSQTFYMISPDGKTGPELGIFLVRI